MLKKMTYLAFILFVIFGYSRGALAIGVQQSEGLGRRHKVPLVCTKPHKEKITLVFSVNENPNQDSRDREYEELKEELEELIEEMKRLAKEAREEVLKEILPRIKREIEKLRERLREWQREDDEPEPLKVKTIEA